METVIRVLIADDIEEWADECAEGLAKKGHVVETAYGVQEALNLIHSSSYNVIFIDIKMEYEDEQGVIHDDGGFLIAQKAKDYLPQAIVVMVTAYDSRDYLVKSLRDIPAYDYLSKNENVEDDVQDLNQMIQSSLEKWKKSLAPNPFHAESGKDPEYTIGNRKNVEDEIGLGELAFLARCFETAMKDQLSRFIVVGDWGTGKSVLLRHFRRWVQKRGFFCSFYEIPPFLPSASPIDVAAEILIGILNGFPMEPSYFQKFISSISKLGLKLKLPNLEGAIEWEKGKTTSVNDIFTKGIQGILDDVERRSDVTTLLLDDFHHLAVLPQVTKTLLAVLGSSRFADKPVAFGVACRPLDIHETQSTDDFEDSVNRFFAGFKVPFSNFTRDEVVTLARHTLVNSGVNFADTVVEEVHKYTDGHPFLTQLLLHHLYENQFRGKVTEDIIRKSLHSFMGEASPYVRKLYGEVGDQERCILRLIARIEEGLPVKGIQHHLVTNNMTQLVVDVDTICSEFEERGILEKSSAGKYNIKHRIYREYLLK